MPAKSIFQFPPNEPIVSMVTFRDVIIIATANGVYKLTDANDDDTVKIEPIEMVPAG